MAPPPKLENILEFRLNALIGAINRGVDKLSNTLDDRLTDLTDVLDDPSFGQDFLEVLAQHTNMLEEIRNKMATQEERLQAAIGKIEAIQAGVDRLQDALEEAKANNPAIEDELAGIEAALEALALDVGAGSEPESGEGGVVTGDSQ